MKHLAPDGMMARDEARMSLAQRRQRVDYCDPTDWSRAWAC
jgi:hypothetical protein